MPSDLLQVENDTKRIARAALKVLMQDGRNPHQEGLTVIRACADADERRNRRGLGSIFRYNHVQLQHDQLEFDPLHVNVFLLRKDGVYL